MKIAFIGAGKVFAPLALQLAEAGHDVALASTRRAPRISHPAYPGGQATNFFCGDDVDQKLVRQLVEEVGFDAVDAGPLKNARLLEPMMLLWVACAQSLGTRDIALRLLRR